MCAEHLGSYAVLTPFMGCCWSWNRSSDLDRPFGNSCYVYYNFINVRNQHKRPDKWRRDLLYDFAFTRTRIRGFNRHHLCLGKCHRSRPPYGWLLWIAKRSFKTKWSHDCWQRIEWHPHHRVHHPHRSWHDRFDWNGMGSQGRRISSMLKYYYCLLNDLIFSSLTGAVIFNGYFSRFFG